MSPTSCRRTPTSSGSGSTATAAAPKTSACTFLPTSTYMPDTSASCRHVGKIRIFSEILRSRSDRFQSHAFHVAYLLGPSASRSTPLPVRTGKLDGGRCSKPEISGRPIATQDRLSTCSNPQRAALLICLYVPSKPRVW